MKKYTKWFIIPYAALGFTLGSTLVSFTATGWAEENGEWVYYRPDGSKATDVLAKSDNNWSYLGSDGVMAKNQLMKKDDNYYYMNSAGIMVFSQQRSIENEDGGGDKPDSYQYYFQSNGKTVERSGSSDSVKFVTLPNASGQGRYAFDDQDQMLSGWIDGNGEMLTDEDAWRSGLCYCSDNDDSHMTTGWEYITAKNDGDTEREGDEYWFYFAANGKKTRDTDPKKISGRKYRSGENGTAHFEWYSDPRTASGSSAISKFYNTEGQCWMFAGWFKAISDKDVDPEDYEKGEIQWYYADSSGGLVTAQIKRINGQSYGFDQYGKILHGLYRIEFEENGKTIQPAEEVKGMDQLPDEDEEGVYVRYFGDSPEEGAVRTGTITIEIDGDKYCYSFSKADNKKGTGVDGVGDDSIFVKSRRVEAEEGNKYQPVTYKDETYLVNIAGKLTKNRKNIRDSNDVYYETDSKGRIVDSGDEKLDQKSIKSIQR